MIGHGKELFGRINVLDTVISEFLGSVLDDPVHDFGHHEYLELVHAAHALQKILEEFRLLVRKEISGNLYDQRVVCHL